MLWSGGTAPWAAPTIPPCHLPFKRMQLHGPWAFVIYDRSHGRIVAARDPAGEEPLACERKCTTGCGSGGACVAGCCSAGAGPGGTTHLVHCCAALHLTAAQHPGRSPSACSKAQNVAHLLPPVAGGTTMLSEGVMFASSK